MKREYKRQWPCYDPVLILEALVAAECKNEKITSISRGLLFPYFKWHEWIKYFQSCLSKTFVLQENMGSVVVPFFFFNGIKTNSEMLLFDEKREIQNLAQSSFYSYKTPDNDN